MSCSSSITIYIDFTTPIWKRFCGEYEDVVVLNWKECRAREFAYSKYSNNGDNNNNNINTNNNNNIKNEYREDNKSTSNSVWNGEVDWRRGYAELTLESIYWISLSVAHEGVNLTRFKLRLSLTNIINHVKNRTRISATNRCRTTSLWFYFW